LKVGKLKTKMRFDVNGIFECHPDRRCVLQYNTDFLTMPIQEAKSLWIQMGVEFGISEARCKRYLLQATPVSKHKPVTDYLRDSGNYDVK